MGKRKARLDYKYTPKLWAAITYLLLVLAALVLFMGRTVKAVKTRIMGSPASPSAFFSFSSRLVMA